MEQHNHQEVVVIMVPFPGQSHLNSLLQLSTLISSSSNLPIHYLASTIHIRQATARANASTHLQLANIHFHSIPIPPFSSPSPNPNSPNKFPIHLQPAFYSTLDLRTPVATYIRHMASKSRRVVVIHDTMMAYVVQDVDSIINAESYSYNAISALSMASFIRPCPVKLPLELPPLEEGIPEEISYLTSLQFKHLGCRDGDLYNTCRLLEAPYLDILETEQQQQQQQPNTKNRKSWAIGPILPTEFTFSSDQNQERHKCLQWLDEQLPNSVIYVAFGSTTSFSDSEIRNLGLGLERSRVKFLWVLRDADKGDIFAGDVRKAELPENYEERITGLGMVVRDWAPQLQILAHRSIGGFMSHCGWNSCVESIASGVPVAAWAMHSEQPVNAVLVTEVLKIGVVVRDWGRRMEPVKAEAIEDAVRRLMVSEEGDGMRRRAAEMGGAVRRGLQDGGDSRVELDSFIAHITR